MLDINTLRNNQAAVIDGLKKRNLGPEIEDVIAKIVKLDDRRKTVQTELDQQLALVNLKSREIGELFKSGQQDQAATLKSEVVEIKKAVKDMETTLAQTILEIETIVIDLPNVPHNSVKAGKGAEDNEITKENLENMPRFEGITALPHWDLAEKYNLIDFKLGVKITGSGFPVFRGKGAKLERGLIHFFLSEASEAGYEEIMPPLLVNEDTARATGQLPDKEGQMYFVEKDNLYLIPTAEVPLTNLLRGDILKRSELPVKLAGYTPCFRREAGSYGSDVKGLNRVHQFDKVEIVQVADPAHSYQVLDEMVAHVEMLLQKLELPYRILRLCGGDMGFTSALTFDFEVYSAAQEKWLEVSSVSNFETFQSNRLKLRFRDGDEKPQLVHTLNGSALALARIMAAILENNQDAEGVKIPRVLHSFTGFDRI
ncbi:MAG: serine--tRNA ligase [Saprospiraceae bacterium]|nr:serine--tRNA ligase [Saprospiraceae bacterium]